jgi:hypothetical protein
MGNGEKRPLLPPQGEKGLTKSRVCLYAGQVEKDKTLLEYS